ncbi:MAG TPA: DUF3467 domain-containing protein [Gemmataceae bacterium]|nr:DUF3467 domain-containing protein [Gemmataceae bacterium]
MGDESRISTPGSAEAQQQQQQPPPVQFQVDTSGMSSAYTNWYRVTGTPEELILDFGLNPQMGQIPTEPIKLTHRVVMNFWTAKRLLSALTFAVQRHESFFGVLEVDVQKRVRGGIPGVGGGRTT